MKDLFKKILLVLMVIVLAFPLNLSNLNIVKAAGGSGTAIDPIIVSTPAEFDNIRSNLNLHYKLDRDINLSGYSDWNPIGNQFNGSLDGNGFKLTGLRNTTNTTYRGLFRDLGPNSVIKDLIIENANIIGNSYTGILASRSLGNGSNRATIDNVRVVGNVTSTGGSYVGGLVGYSNYTDYKNINTNVSMSMLNVSSYVGGISGQSSYDTLRESHLEGSLISTFSNNGAPVYYGGAFGYTNNTELSDVISVVNVSNNFTGGTGSTGYTASNFGGVIGQSNNGSLINVVSTGYLRMGASYNYYKVGSNFGGIVGNSNNTNFDKVVNKGEVDAAYNTAAGYYYVNNVGGIVGSHNNGNVTKTVNYGEVKYSADTIWSNLTNVGGIFGIATGPSGYSTRGSVNSLTVNNTVNHGNITLKQNTSINNVGGFAGTLNYVSMDDSYSSGDVNVSSYSNNQRNNYNIAGFAGYVLDGSNSKDSNYPNINRVYSSGSVSTYNGGSSNYYASGLISYKQIPVTSSFYVGKSVNDTHTNNISYRYGLFNSNSYISENNFYNSNQNYSVNNNGSTGTKTDVELKTFAPYSSVGWSINDWGIESGKGFPYIKKLSSLVIPYKNFTKYQSAIINLKYLPYVEGVEAPKRYQLIFEEKRPGSDKFTRLSGSFESTDPGSYNFNVPKGTPGNTEFRWKIRSLSGDGSWGAYYNNWTNFTFTNNVPVIDVKFVENENNFTTSLSKRVMNFSLDDVIDPDDFSYLNLYVELEGVVGSKSKVLLPGNKDLTGIEKHSSLKDGISAPLASGAYGKKEFKLKLIPKFSSSENVYDLVVVEKNDESNILATLIKNKTMQDVKASSPESYKLKVYMEDSQKQVGGKLSDSNVFSQDISIDTRNYLPHLTDVKDDVDGRVMSMNQGYNLITFNGKVSDLDPSDDVDIFYTVKSLDDTDGGVYVVNPLTDKKIASFKASNYSEGVKLGEFSSTYTVSDDLSTGDYVLLVYGKDSRGGIGELHEIPFEVARKGPDIQFYSEHDGNILSTSTRQVVTKPSKLKMYFSSTDYVTFEYAGYLINEDQQRSDGEYIDLNTRGSFTNDVKSSFIGINLLDEKFKFGDILLFKFRAVSSTGEKIEKDIRIKIGDKDTPLNNLEDQFIPDLLK